jgi:xanthosine utilization system XapX-like protein
MYLVSLGAGILAGVIDGVPLSRAWFASECRPKITGVLPDANKDAAGESRHG